MRACAKQKEKGFYCEDRVYDDMNVGDDAFEDQLKKTLDAEDVRKHEWRGVAVQTILYRMRVHGWVRFAEDWPLTTPPRGDTSSSKQVRVLKWLVKFEGVSFRECGALMVSL